MRKRRTGASQNHDPSRARDWLLALTAEILRRRGVWLRPHVTAGLKGEVELEWWHGGRSLTVYFRPDGESSIESWGPNMDTQMREGDAGSREARAAIWDRLVR